MASEFSLYRKIEVVLDIAKSEKINSIKDLRDKIAGQKPPNFITKQYDKKHDTFLPDISIKGIRRTIGMCHKLHLIDDGGQLTEFGRSALRASDYNRILSERVHNYLKEHEIQISMLNSIISKSLRAEPLIMSTSAEIWKKCGTKIRLLEFSQVLTLLTQCGSANSSQRKIYLHFKE